MVAAWPLRRKPCIGDAEGDWSACREVGNERPGNIGNSKGRREAVGDPNGDSGGLEVRDGPNLESDPVRKCGRGWDRAGPGPDDLPASPT